MSYEYYNNREDMSNTEAAKATETKETIFAWIKRELTRIKIEYPIGFGFLIGVFVSLCVLMINYRSNLSTIGKTFINNNYKKFYKI